jgi:hypothetical protein
MHCGAELEAGVTGPAFEVHGVGPHTVDECRNRLSQQKLASKRWGIRVNGKWLEYKGEPGHRIETDSRTAETIADMIADPYSKIEVEEFSRWNR